MKCSKSAQRKADRAEAGERRRSQASSGCSRQFTVLKWGGVCLWTERAANGRGLSKACAPASALLSTLSAAVLAQGCRPDGTGKTEWESGDDFLFGKERLSTLTAGIVYAGLVGMTLTCHPIQVPWQSRQEGIISRTVLNRWRNLRLREVRKFVHRPRMNSKTASKTSKREPQRGVVEAFDCHTFPREWRLSIFLHKCFLLQVFQGSSFSILTTPKFSSYIAYPDNMPGVGD